MGRSGAQSWSSRIVLGGTPLTCDSLEWPLVFGCESPEVEITVSSDVALALASAPAPCSLEVECEAWNGAQPISAADVFEGVFVWRVGPASNPWLVKVTLRDRRALWEELRVSGEFNVIRRTNAQRIPGYAVRPGFARGQHEFERIAAYRYLPRSLLREGTTPPRHADATLRIGEGGARAWTAADVVAWLFSQIPAELAPRDVVMSADLASRYVPENEVLLEERWPDAARRFCDLARIAFYLRDDVVHVRSLEEAPRLDNLGQYEGGGYPSIASYAPARARKIVARVPKLHELRADYVERESASAPRGELYLENTACCPQRVKDPAGGWIERSEERPLAELLDAWAEDRDHPWPAGLELNFHWLRRLMLHPQIAWLFCWDESYADYVDPVRAARVACALESYRKRFRFCEAWSSCFTEWYPRAVTLVDPRTGAQPTSPVWCDHTIVPTRSPLNRRKKTPLVLRIRAWDAAEAARSRPRLSEASGTLDATVVVVSQPLGIFRLALYRELQGQRSHTILGLVRDEPAYDFYASGGIALWDEKAAIQPDWRLSIVFSAQLATPPTSARHWEEHIGSYEFTEEACDGPERHLFVAREPLRVGWDDATSKPRVNGDGYLEVEGGTMLNEEIIRHLVHHECDRVYFSLRDRLIGSYRSPWWIPDVCQPRGHCRAVVFFYERGEFGAEFRFPEPPPAKDLWETLPGSAKRVVYPRLLGEETS